ncbi:uncharacterized protein LY79DRAFT_389420 [Colletotrichum navitas]|uniref:Uncharacterized protein n=1 Tax=Colletotrichum navitas TaxID=681940 RepID=A0AAD8V1A4_9PEZI|nr:uncharacterized protein LY79DRAFT_389420 [Colletotrichum navitas]KAK1574109.1 hypothetical protein LY79DRAFT_389420 [Colletotrichum navitas]
MSSPVFKCVCVCEKERERERERERKKEKDWAGRKLGTTPPLPPSLCCAVLLASSFFPLLRTQALHPYLFFDATISRIASARRQGKQKYPHPIDGEKGSVLVEYPLPTWSTECYAASPRLASPSMAAIQPNHPVYAMRDRAGLVPPSSSLTAHHPIQSHPIPSHPVSSCPVLSCHVFTE